MLHLRWHLTATVNFDDVSNVMRATEHFPDDVHRIASRICAVSWICDTRFDPITNISNRCANLHTHCIVDRRNALCQIFPKVVILEKSDDKVATCICILFALRCCNINIGCKIDINHNLVQRLNHMQHAAQRSQIADQKVATR